MSDIYLLFEGVRQGPFTLDQVTRYLEQGRIGMEQRAWREGFADWVPVSELLRGLREPVGVAQSEAEARNDAATAGNRAAPQSEPDIYLLVEGERQGPFSFEQVTRYLAQSRIAKNQPARRGESDVWVDVSDLLRESRQTMEETKAEQTDRTPAASDDRSRAQAPADIYLLVEDESQGPFLVEQVKRYLAQGRIGKDQPARREGGTDWVAIESLLGEIDKPVVEAPAAAPVKGVRAKRRRLR